LTPKGAAPTSVNPRQPKARLTISTDTRPSSVQYTSCSRRMSANSSRTSDVPVPTATAAIAAAAVPDDEPTATKAPETSRMIPGTAWWTWVPLGEMLLWKGPRPARIARVMPRVVRKVMTNAAKHSSSASLPGSTMSRCHQSWTMLPTYGLL
jgi:hypothetical protein